MKKVLIILIILLCVGCGNNKNSENENYNIDLELAKTNISKLKFDEDFTFTDTSSINNIESLEFYGVEMNLIEEKMVYISSVITDPSMYMILKVSDDNKSVVKYQINDMFEKYYNAYNNYYPKEAKMIQDRLEKELNGYLIYIVSYDNNAVYQAITASQK